MSTTNSPATSEGENVPEIQALTERVRVLNQATDWWNAAMILALVLAAISAVAVVGTTMMALKRAKQVADAQSELLQAKDKQLALDLGDKDVKIAQAGRDASKANRGAAEANERATKAQESLALAEQHSVEANTKAEGFRLDIAKANERAASANETAERERLARLQLEARLADRVLTPDGQSRLVALAARFPRGTRIDICMFGGTLEIANITGSINKSLVAGGWTVRQWQVTGGGAVRGILIGTNPSADAATARAASGIVSTLVSAGIGAGPWKFDELVAGGMRQGPGEPMDAPIRMFIGSKQ
jgi:hypothetical protein